MEKSEHLRFQEDFKNPTVIRRSLARGPLRIFAQTLYIFLEARIIDPHSAADSISLSSLKFLVGSVKRLFSVSMRFGRLRSLILVPIESAYATSY